MSESEDEEHEKAWDEGLSLKHRLFCLHYCTNQEALFNATESYIRTYTKKDRKTGAVYTPDRESASASGSKLMKRQDIREACRKLLKLTQADLDEENVYKVINNLVTLAFFNPADVIQADGSLAVHDLHALGEKAKTIKQITQGPRGPQIELIDRTKYIDMLMKYLNIIRPEQQVEISLPVIEMVPKQDKDTWNKQTEEK